MYFIFKERYFRCCKRFIFSFESLFCIILSLTNKQSQRLCSSICFRFVNLGSNKLDLDNLSVDQSDYWPILAYGQSKLCNIMMSYEFDNRMRSKGVTCAALHPGNMIYTGIKNNWWMWRLLWLLARPFSKSLVSIYYT